MISNLVPRYFFLTRGVGVHRSRLLSFETALRDTRIPQFNLVTVSSILPPGCERVGIEQGLRRLQPGEIVFCVLARADTLTAGEEIGAAVSLARPADRTHYGYIAEHHGSGFSEQELEQRTCREAEEMLATCQPGEQDGARMLETLSIAQTARGAGGERWTTVVAAVVFILEHTHDRSGS